MRSRTIALLATTLMTAPALQPLAVAQLAGGAVTPAAQPVTASAGTTITGTALRTDLKPLPAATVRLRHVDTTSIVGTVTAGPSGEFAFPSVQAGNYMIEVIDLSGRVLGVAPPFVLDGSRPVSVSVIASGSGVTPSYTDNGGFSLFGLGPTATLAVLGAAGTAALTAVISTRQDASPSR